MKYSDASSSCSSYLSEEEEGSREERD